jgi:hypothetical protein
MLQAPDSPLPDMIVWRRSTICDDEAVPPLRELIRERDPKMSEKGDRRL